MLLERFNLGPADLLGRGGEAEVYALDGARVLRIYKPQVPAEYIARRHAFYERVGALRPPFELPQILEAGVAQGRSFAIERRMRGRDFAAALPALDGPDRERALASYLTVAAQIGEIALDGQPFGELLAPGAPLQRASWPQFLWDRAQQALAASRGDLEQDVPGLDAKLDALRDALRELDGFAERRLVHGDYFPGNVYIDGLSICGVGDFGYTSLAGDPRMDLAGAVAYMEVVDGYRPGDTAFLTRLALARHGPGLARWLEVYRVYYSLYFSTCKRDDPRTYAWCVASLRRWPA